MLSELLASLARELDRNGIPYMIIGGQAVLLYAQPRTTRDIDVTLGVGVDELPALLRVARSLGLRLLADDPRDFAVKTMVLPCAHEPSGLRVDLVFSWSPYERQAIERAKLVEVAGVRVRYASPEDLLVHKMVAGRPRDLEDVRQILVKATPIDFDYVHNWLAQFEPVVERPLVEPFEQIRSQASRPGT